MDIGRTAEDQHADFLLHCEYDNFREFLQDEYLEYGEWEELWKRFEAWQDAIPSVNDPQEEINNKFKEGI